MLSAWFKSASQYRDMEKGKYELNEAYITFATLTLPTQQKHSDTEIKRKILIPFIEKLQRIYSVKHYYWRAEPQVNGNVHFHLLIDRYIAKNWLQNEWNVATDKLGYLEEYFEQTGSLFPPSTDIRKPDNDKNAANYVSKYVTKAPEKIRSIKPTDQGREVRVVMVAEHKEWQGSEKYYHYRKLEGRVWGSSEELKKLTVFNTEESKRVQKVMWIAERQKKAKVFRDEFYTVVRCDVEDVLKRFDKVLYARYIEFYSDQFHYLYDKKEDKAEPPKRDDSNGSLTRAAPSFVPVQLSAFAA